MGFKAGELTVKNGREEITAWAVRRGFEQTCDGRLTIPYDGTQIVIAFRKLGLVVTHERGEQVLRVASPYFIRLGINEFDVLEGAGLHSWFSNRFLEKGVEVPWFSDEYKAKLREFAENSKANSRNRGLCE